MFLVLFIQAYLVDNGMQGWGQVGNVMGLMISIETLGIGGTAWPKQTS